QLGTALDALRGIRSDDTPVILATAVGRGEREHTRITTLARVEPQAADMRTLVLVGASTTRVFRHAGRDYVYTPRSYGGGGAAA
ncbi:MAG: precorrin-3B C(17)-methyltransferase, partial [Ectothiorhodospiraceae bacterium]